MPDGYNWAQLTCSLLFTSNTSSIYTLTTVNSTSTGFPVIQYSLKFSLISLSSDIPRVDVNTGIRPAEPGDVYIISISNFGPSTIAIYGSRSWCQFQVFR